MSLAYRRDEPYADYVIRCRQNEMALQVKLADLIDNTRLDRFILRPGRIDRDLVRIHLSRFAQEYSVQGLGERRPPPQ